MTIRPAGKWAAEKLDYLRRYIDVFETSMHNKWPVRNYIDLLAGPGKNKVRGTDQILLGSPLLALKTRFPFTGYYFVDSDPDNITTLRERCKASGYLAQIHIDSGNCNLIVDHIVNDIRFTKKTSLNLAFLDPEGLELRWMTVAKLASIPKMDLVINYPQGGLNRVMANVYQSNDDNSVDLFFGTRTWRDIYTGYRESRTISLHRELIDLYKSQLQKLGY